MSTDLTAILLALSGSILALVFRFYPPANTWFSTLPNKGLVMLGFVIGLAGLYFGAGCVPALASYLHIAVSCDQKGALDLVSAIWAIASGNQLTYLFTKPSAAG